MKRTLLALGVACAILGGCNGSSTSSFPPAPQTAAPVAPTAAPTAAPAPVAIASFGAFSLVAGSAGTFTMINFTQTIADFSYVAAVPAIGNGASCQPLSIGPWGTHPGQTSGSTVGVFGSVPVTDALPFGHYGAFTLTVRTVCSDGRTSQTYTAPVVMP